MASRPITQPNTYGTIVGNAAMSLLDTSFAATFTSGFNDSALGWVNYATDIGAVNVLAATLTQAPSTYTAGLTVAIKIANTNTGSVTLNLNALGAQGVVNRAGIALTGGELPVNAVIPMVHDGTNFRVLGHCPFIVNNQTLSANVTYNCAGFTSISALLTWSGGTGNTPIFQNVAFGIPVSISLGNSTGTNHFYSVSMTNPSGSSYANVFALLSGVSTGSAYSDIQAVSFQINTGNSVLLNGSTTNNQAFLSR